jgi:hypothetical protein
MTDTLIMAAYIYVASLGAVVIWFGLTAEELDASDERGLSDAEQAEIAVHHERGRWE